MTYATQQNLIDRFGERELIELTDRSDPSTGAIDATVVAKALADADAEIDGYLSSRYQLPLSPVPAKLERVAGDIARYYLYEDRVTDQVRARFSDAQQWLRDVASGKVSLGATSGGVAPTPADTVQFEPGQKVFAREDL